MLKKVKELTVEELISLGKADSVRNLRITIQNPNTENKHWDVIIGGTGYQRKLFLEDEVKVPDSNGLFKIEIWVGHDKVNKFSSDSFREIRKWFDENYRDNYNMGFCTYYISKDDEELDWRLLNK